MQSFFQIVIAEITYGKNAGSGNCATRWHSFVLKWNEPSRRYSSLAAPVNGKATHDAPYHNSCTVRHLSACIDYRFAATHPNTLLKFACFANLSNVLDIQDAPYFSSQPRFYLSIFSHLERRDAPSLFSSQTTRRVGRNKTEFRTFSQSKEATSKC